MRKLHSVRITRRYEHIMDRDWMIIKWKHIGLAQFSYVSSVFDRGSSFLGQMRIYSYVPFGINS